MVTLAEYLNNPCGTLSIPYWKAKNIVVPTDIKILHDKDFSADILSEYTDEKYFRLYHSLKEIPEIATDDFEITTATRRNIKTIVQIINDSYTDISVNKELIKSYTKTPVYNENLWIMVKEKATGKFVGCGLADYDAEVKELILEWIQVLPQYRGKKIGQLIVTELLNRMKDIADFATVSGKVDNATNPEGLYRKCGFVGSDVWHILHKNK
ncbi:MAG: GNAT family N-acetyltransferase [Clostridia bacterium]|nr:GNAT family N-acetyltransferase [Clostridia bacterium]